MPKVAEADYINHGVKLVSQVDTDGNSLAVDNNDSTDTKGTYVYGRDVITNTIQPISLDRDGRYLPTINEDHTRIHEGLAFICTGEIVVSGSSTLYFAFDNTAAATTAHLRIFKFESEQGNARVTLFRDSTSSGGTACTPVNLNSWSSNTSNLIPRIDAAVTVDGTKHEGFRIRGDKKSGASGTELVSEHIIKPGAMWSLKYENLATQDDDIDYFFYWYRTSAS